MREDDFSGRVARCDAFSSRCSPGTRTTI